MIQKKKIIVTLIIFSCVIFSVGIVSCIASKLRYAREMEVLRKELINNYHDFLDLGSRIDDLNDRLMNLQNSRVNETPYDSVSCQIWNTKLERSFVMTDGS